MDCPHNDQVHRGNQLECRTCGAALDQCLPCHNGHHEHCFSKEVCECTHQADARRDRL